MDADTNFGSLTISQIMEREYCIGEPAEDKDVVNNQDLEAALKRVGVEEEYIGKIMAIKYGHGSLVKKFVDAVKADDLVTARIFAETLKVRVGFDPRGEGSKNTRYFSG